MSSIKVYISSAIYLNLIGYICEAVIKLVTNMCISAKCFDSGTGLVGRKSVFHHQEAAPQLRENRLPQLKLNSNIDTPLKVKLSCKAGRMKNVTFFSKD